MRREQVHKICLNHALMPDIKYISKDEKTWMFMANDFSEEELLLQKFCLRFANKEIANEFKNIIDKVQKGTEPSTIRNEDTDVIFVKEIQDTLENKEKAKALMLPENFFINMDKKPCPGCRGCKDDIENSTLVTKTPCKNVQFETSTSSPSNSLYATPTSTTKPNTSIFRTPLLVVGQNTKTENPTKQTFSSEFKDKENKAVSTKPALSSIFGHSTINTQNILNNEQKSNIFNNKTNTLETNSSLSGLSTSNFDTSLGSSNNNNEQFANIFQGNRNIFGSANPSNGNLFNQNNGKFTFGNVKPIIGDNKDNHSGPQSTLHLKIDENLSFKALSASSTDFNSSNINGKWLTL